MSQHCEDGRCPCTAPDDVAAAPLNEQGNRIGTKAIFDNLRGKPGQVGRIGSAGDPLNRMHGEVVHHSQRRAIQPIQPQQPDLRIDRPTASTSLSAGSE